MNRHVHDFDEAEPIDRADAPDGDVSPRPKQKSSTTPEPVKAESAKPAKAKGRKKRVLITLAVLGGLGLGGWYGYHWWTTGRYIESTDDAYVKADIVGLSAQVSGAVDKVPVDDNQSVDAGTILLQIDDREYRAADASAQAAIDASDATLANVREQRILQERAIDVDKADLATAKANLEFVNADFERNKTLRKRGTVSARQMQQVQTNLAAARASLAKTQAVIARDTQQLSVLDSQKRQAEAQRENALASKRVSELNLERTVIRAPEAGIVGNREIQSGEYVRPGMRLMSVVPAADIYVIANFKETQIEHVRDGMGVDVEADMLGGQTVKGTIDSLAPASGSEFAVLPPQNATGNFTKIVQRVPIKIRLEDRPGDALRLKPGTSVVVNIDTKGVRR